MRDNMMIVDNNKLLVAFEDDKLLVEFGKMLVVVDDVEQNDVEMTDDMEQH